MLENISKLYIFYPKTSSKGGWEWRLVFQKSLDMSVSTVQIIQEIQ